MLNQYVQAGGGVVVMGPQASRALHEASSVAWAPFQSVQPLNVSVEPANTTSAGNSTTPVVVSATIQPVATNNALLVGVATFTPAQEQDYFNVTLPENATLVANFAVQPFGLTLPFVVLVPPPLSLPADNSSGPALAVPGQVVGLYYNAPSTDAPLQNVLPPLCADYTRFFWNASSDGFRLVSNALQAVYRVPVVQAPPLEQIP